MYDDDNTNFSYSFTDEPNVVHLLFNDALSESAPNKFVVKGDIFAFLLNH